MIPPIKTTITEKEQRAAWANVYCHRSQRGGGIFSDWHNWQFECVTSLGYDPTSLAEQFASAIEWTVSMDK